MMPGACMMILRTHRSIICQTKVTNRTLSDVRQRQRIICHSRPQTDTWPENTKFNNKFNVILLRVCVLCVCALFVCRMQREKKCILPTHKLRNIYMWYLHSKHPDSKSKKRPRATTTKMKRKRCYTFGVSQKYQQHKKVSTGKIFYIYLFVFSHEYILWAIVCVDILFCIFANVATTMPREYRTQNRDWHSRAHGNLYNVVWLQTRSTAVDICASKFYSAYFMIWALDLCCRIPRASRSRSVACSFSAHSYRQRYADIIYYFYGKKKTQINLWPVISWQRKRIIFSHAPVLHLHTCVLCVCLLTGLYGRGYVDRLWWQRRSPRYTITSVFRMGRYSAM